MWWMAIVGAANGLLQGDVARHAAKNNNRLSKLNAEVGNRNRQLANQAAAAQGNLARWVQSVNNNRFADDAGKALAANLETYYRDSDMQINRGLSEDIRAAEQQGMQTAQAAAVGAVGNTVDMVSASTVLRYGLVDQQIENLKAYNAYDTTRRAGNIMSQMVSGMDSSIILDTLDYNVDVAKEIPIMSHFANALQGSAASMGVTGQGEQVMKTEGKGETFRPQSSGGFAMRQRSSSPYDLADHAFDNKVKFGYKMPDSDQDSTYSLGTKRLGSDEDKPSYSSIYSLYSR